MVFSGCNIFKMRSAIEATTGDEHILEGQNHLQKAGIRRPRPNRRRHRHRLPKSEAITARPNACSLNQHINMFN